MEIDVSSKMTESVSVSPYILVLIYYYGNIFLTAQIRSKWALKNKIKMSEHWMTIAVYPTVTIVTYYWCNVNMMYYWLHDIHMMYYWLRDVHIMYYWLHDVHMMYYQCDIILTPNCNTIWCNKFLSQSTRGVQH